jgi:hypothetical protein
MSAPVRTPALAGNGGNSLDRKLPAKQTRVKIDVASPKVWHDPGSGFAQELACGWCADIANLLRELREIRADRRRRR